MEHVDMDPNVTVACTGGGKHDMAQQSSFRGMTSVAANGRDLA